MFDPMRTICFLNFSQIVLHQMSGLHGNEGNRIVALGDRLRIVGHKNRLSALRRNDALLFLQRGMLVNYGPIQGCE